MWGERVRGDVMLRGDVPVSGTVFGNEAGVLCWKAGTMVSGNARV